MSRRNSSGLFLMEMIMVVGFFLLCTGICISVFVKADTISRLAKDTNQAVLLAQTTVERLKAEGTGEIENIAALKEDDAYILYWDKDGSPVKEASLDGYQGIVTIAREGSMEIVKTDIYSGKDDFLSGQKDAESLCSLTSEIYERERR